MLLGRLTSNAKAVQKQEGEDLQCGCHFGFLFETLSVPRGIGVHKLVTILCYWCAVVVLSPIYRLTLGTLDCIFDREGYYCQVSIHILGTHLLHLSCTEIVCLSIIQRGTHAANVLWFLSNRPILWERNVPFSKYLLHKREKIKSFG